jgi:hypothetical protein
VRLLTGLEPKLKMAGLPQDFATQFHHRFAGASRSELDREGRVVESLLASAHPAQGVKLYDTLAKLQSHVTPGGFHVAANQHGSWTVTPPKEDPFVFAGKPGEKLALADGTKLSMASQGLMTLSHPTGEAHLQESLSRGLTPRLTHGVLNAATVIMSALANHVPKPGGAIARALEHLPSKEPFLESLRIAAATPGPGQPAAVGILLAANAAITLAELTPSIAELAMSVIDNAGRSAAPSRRADPELEKAVLFMEIGLAPKDLMKSLTEVAGKLHGAARDAVLIGL